VNPPPSVALMVKLKAPAWVGVPLSTPVLGFNDRPAGSTPALTP